MECHGGSRVFILLPGGSLSRPMDMSSFVIQSGRGLCRIAGLGEHFADGLKIDSIFSLEWGMHVPGERVVVFSLDRPAQLSTG
jgi:hypothetical protein